MTDADLQKLVDAAKSGTPYVSRPGLVPVTPAAWGALARASGVERGHVVIGREPHAFVARKADGLLVLAIGEDTPGGPIDPDVVGPIDPDISAA